MDSEKNGRKCDVKGRRGVEHLVVIVTVEGGRKGARKGGRRDMALRRQWA